MHNAARTLEPCTGYFIHRITLDESDEDPEENALAVWLRAGPDRPDVVVSLAGLHSVRPWEPGLTPVFVDGISLVHLPRLPDPWPAKADGRLDRTPELPEAAWLRITGPLEVDAVGSIVTVYPARSDDEASELR
ncbi:hypothetical protein [Kitasatospora phosalacinea]|uniref:Uncharacterized protein n=1 Tax=Kitasatospora phosalacinea TaxID=2065 RepID=A0ABW6GN56_9ACTN